MVATPFMAVGSGGTQAGGPGEKKCDFFPPGNEMAVSHESDLAFAPGAIVESMDGMAVVLNKKSSIWIWTSCPLFWLCSSYAEAGGGGGGEPRSLAEASWQKRRRRAAAAVATTLEIIFSTCVAFSPVGNGDVAHLKAGWGFLYTRCLCKGVNNYYLLQAQVFMSQWNRHGEKSLATLRV